MSPRFLWKNQFGEDNESSLDLGAGSISGCPHGDDQCPSAWTDMELGGSEQEQTGIQQLEMG